MRRLRLREYRTECNVELTVAERDAIRDLHPGITIEPVPHTANRYDLTPDQRVGIVATSELVVEIRPKLPVSSALFLIAYASDAADWFDKQPEFSDDAGLSDIVAVMLARLVERATRRGLLHGYRSEDEALQAPRGQIRFDEQIRRRLGLAPPVEVRHDTYTADIVENRMLRSAISVLARMPLDSALAKRELTRAQSLFGEVRLMRYARSSVPEVAFTRLNRHYESPLSLAVLVLKSMSIDLGMGGARGSAFLIDMNVVFETFVRKALRRALDLDLNSFPDRPPSLRFDEAGRVPLRPDLCVVEAGSVVWVGDAKYKRLPPGAYTNADLYQLLAYCVTLGLDGGTLIYAADEGVGSAQHVVKKVGKRLLIIALDPTSPPNQLLRQIESIASSIRPIRSREGVDW